MPEVSYPLGYRCRYGRGMAQSLEDLVHPSWVPVLEGQRQTLADLGEFLRAEGAAGRPWPIRSG